MHDDVFKIAYESQELEANTIIFSISYIIRVRE
jgi:hypothetical protein